MQSSPCPDLPPARHRHGQGRPALPQPQAQAGPSTARWWWCPPDARSKAKEGKGPHPQHCCSTWFSPRFALTRCRSHGPRAAFPGSPGWRGGCLPCLLPWPGRSSRQPMMRDWCWEIVHGSRCRVIACCLRCAAFSWLVGNGQGGGVRPGESRAQAPREPARRILFLPCMQGNKTDTARSRSGDSSALPPC